MKTIESSKKINKLGPYDPVLVSLLNLGETNQNNDVQQCGVCEVCGLDQP